MFNLQDHQVERTVMMWGIKFKDNKARSGKLLVMEECKVMTPIKYLTPERMQNIKVMLQKQSGVWNGYDSEAWVRALDNEFIYRNKRVDVLINQAIKLAEFNIMGKIFQNSPREAFMKIRG